MNSHMTVGKKLTVIGALLIGLTIVLGVVTLVGLSGYQKTVTALADDALAGVSACSKVEASFLELRGLMWRQVASDDPTDVERLEGQIQSLEQELASENKDLQGAIVTDEEREINRKIDPALANLYAAWEKVSVLTHGKKNEEAYRQFAEATPAILEIKAAIRAEADYNRTDGAKYAAEAVATGARMKWLTWVLLLLSITLGSGLLFLFVRSLTQALLQAVSELTEGAGQVSSASAQVASSSQSLAQGSSEQAASLEETSASSEEITSMTRKNAENSATAATLMADVDQRVQEGNRTLEEMMQSMREITGSSDKISKIIKVIDEIAFQTNILALNAAVEAARAGEAGMGFAVVADEVRNLAQRSAQAAKDTAALIEESIAKSNEGGTRLERVSEVIRAITESTVKVKTLVDEVNLGSQEQARGIEQISKAITQMDQVTQSTAASAEEGASASEELSAQAEAMGHAVRKLAQLVDDHGERGAGSPVLTSTVKKNTAKSPKHSTAPASRGPRALKPVAPRPAASMPVASRPVPHKLLAAPETDQDAEFLASFKEM
ncbi:MAG TPA: methyl-accepting chemotaxis protein [Bryobacteraceae bacterium]|nr:methyl-accepting chemotaxis protein [Bryobacteraceae bacterium]